jgi:hypothetical protein
MRRYESVHYKTFRLITAVVYVLSLLCLGAYMRSLLKRQDTLTRFRGTPYIVVRHSVFTIKLCLFPTVLTCRHGWLHNGLRTRGLLSPVTPVIWPPCGHVPSLPSRQDGIPSTLPLPPSHPPTLPHSLYSIAEASNLSASITLLSLIIIKIDFLKSQRPLSQIQTAICKQDMLEFCYRYVPVLSHAKRWGVFATESLYRYLCTPQSWNPISNHFFKCHDWILKARCSKNWILHVSTCRMSPCLLLCDIVSR